MAQLSTPTPSGHLADAGYGIDTAFRTGLGELGLTYVVGIQSSTSLWPPGAGPLPPSPFLVRRSSQHSPVAAKAR